MIGLRFPKLFYGRKQRQQGIGDRADFCEFCVCVCRHRVISFQSAPTVFFIASQFEEFKRESRCEICRTQFPLAMNSKYQNLGPQTAIPIKELVHNTNPNIVDQSLHEANQMVERSDDPSLFQKNQIRNFLRMHDLEYRARFRELFPLIAISSIQALIFGFTLYLIVEKWLVFGLVGSAYLLVILILFLSKRNKVFQTFAGGIVRLEAITELGLDRLDAELVREGQQFPQVVAIFRKQVANRKTGLESDLSFEAGVDFVPVLHPALAHKKTPDQRELD